MDLRYAASDVRPLVVGVLLTGAIAGCTPAPRGLSWTIEFESTALHDQTSVVEARILQGGCAGSTVVYRAEARASGTMAMRPPELGPGTYGFAASARDASCNEIGSDCVAVVLPGPTMVNDVLHALAGMPACPPALCHTGSCEVDAGVRDAGPGDTGAMDGGGGLDDVGLDAAMPDAFTCPPTETSCTGGTDEDCDGHTDCADSDCTSDPACAACLGVSCGACQACNPATGMCGPATDGDVCTGGHCLGGACCTGCVQGGTCQTGNTTSACGTGGAGCATCGDCTSCNGTSCTPVGSRDVCAGGAGRCASGTCCTGCIDGAGNCNTGSAATACGSGGSDCTSCGDCRSCNGSTCVGAGDGTPCSTGSCLGGSCCNGCFVVGTCQPGTSEGACGPVGGSCTACGECQLCDGSRSCAPVADGTPCRGGMGQCASGACCQTCRAGSTCVGGTLDTQCGFAGGACGQCFGGTSCTAGGTCSGTGDTCSSFIEITGVGDVYIPIDTCLYNDNFTISGCANSGSADVVLSGLQSVGSGYHIDAPSGWTVGYLDPAGSCSPLPSSCGQSYGASGTTGDVRYWFGVERTDGTCGAAILHVQAFP